MATIIGGIGTSHVPTIGMAYDKGKQDDPAWKPLFDGYAPVARWLAERKPDVLVFFYNDHVTSFFFDNYPTFTIGVDPSFRLADEGAGVRPLPPLRGHPALAAHITESLVNDEFDMSVFQDRPLDHGCNSPLSLMWPHAPDWPGALVPIAINVLRYPLPTPLRCYKLGQAVRRAVESYPEDLSVVIVGTGGLSHQVHGERTGFNNTEWDMRFLDLIERDPAALTSMRHADYVRLGGAEGAEVIMWLVMRGALSPKIRRLHRSYYLPSMTGSATAIYEDQASSAPVPDPEYLAHIHHQLAGIEKLHGTYPFTLARSVKSYRLNKFLHALIDPDWRARFRTSQESLFDEAGLTFEERHLVRSLDWRGIIHYGVSFFMLEKLGAVVGASNLHIYAAMRGETLDEFRKTRNAPGALYSVAGSDAKRARPAWDS